MVRGIFETDPKYGKRRYDLKLVHLDMYPYCSQLKDNSLDSGTEYSMA